jgi:hypothetical protein
MWRGLNSIIVVAAVVLAGCASSSDNASVRASESEAAAPVPDVVIDDGRVTDDALAAATDGEDANARLLEMVVDEIAAMPEADRLLVAAELSRRLELEAARVTGLEAAIGSAAQTEAALDGAWAPIAAQVDSTAAELATQAEADPAAVPSGFRSAPPEPTSAAGMTVIGVMMGMMGLGMVADVAVSAANDFKAGQNESQTLGSGSVIGGSVEASTLEMKFEGTQDGVAVRFQANLDVHPCPDPNGKFDISVTIDIQTSKGGAVSGATIDMAIDGQVDDNANLAGADVVTNTQWSGGSSAGTELIEFTHKSSGDKSAYTTERLSDGASEGFVKLTVMFSAIFEFLIKDKALQAAEKAWTSGRCVDLKVTPSAGPKDLDPSAVVDVLAEPRSKVDGAPTGGNVTATLTAGGKSVEPDGSPVPADASFVYTAPDEQKKSGTVKFESRSRRGVGRTEVTFETKGAAAYLVVGGLEDWQVSQVVCDIMAPFVLTSPGVGVAEFTGGLTGAYSATGVFNFSYQGTYEIVLSNGPGSPGTMSASSGGSIAGEAGSGTEQYVLTPAEPCE